MHRSERRKRRRENRNEPKTTASDLVTRIAIAAKILVQADEDADTANRAFSDAWQSCFKTVPVGGKACLFRRVATASGGKMWIYSQAAGRSLVGRFADNDPRIKRQQHAWRVLQSTRKTAVGARNLLTKLVENYTMPNRGR